MIPITYIGEKEKKRDTITGSRLVFPRNQSVEVEDAIAHRLLEFPTVFIKSSKVAEYLQEHVYKVDADRTALAAAEEEARKLALNNSFELQIGSDTVDLGKMTSAQLLTLVESHDLDLIKGATEKVDDFRTRVRDALKAKLAALVGE